MSGSNPDLKRLLQQLQKGAGLAPPTPEEADALMDGPEEAPIDDARLLDIADAVVRGQPAAPPEVTPLPWAKQEAMTEVDCEEFALNRNKGEVDGEMQEKIDAAEQKALADEGQDGDEQDGTGSEANPS